MSFSASDVPGRVDLVINSVGYLLDKRQEPNASHEYTPTFVPRQNFTGSYGDNQQEFWMVLAQSDWSGGEQQRYVRVNDEESRRRYWKGSAVDISVEGQVSLAQATVPLTPGGAIIASTNWKGLPVFTVASTLYKVESGAISSLGAFTASLTGHGAYGLAADGVNVFIASPTGGTNGGIRKYNGSAFSDFKTGLGITSIEYLNNTLFGVGAISGGKTTLYSFGTDGTATTIYEWQTADGVADALSIGRLRKFGGSLVFISLAEAGILFQYESDAPVEIAQMPPDFLPTEIAVSEGIIFIGGSFIRNNYTAGKWYHQPAILFYADGVLNELWRADRMETTGTSSATDTTLTANPVPYLNGIVWWDPIRAQLTYYDIRTGAINGVSASTTLTGLGCFSGVAFFNGPDSSHCGFFPDSANLSSTGYVQTSLFDADNSLSKYWKSVKVDADLPTGSSVDIAYRLNDVDGSFTTLQSSAAVGTEYTLGQSARSISIQVTLNKGSGGSPVLKRIYLRGVPIQDTFRRSTYIIDCTGKDALNPVVLNDSAPHPLTGLAMATALRTAATVTTPFTMTDEFGTYTALIEPDSFSLERVRDREYRAKFTVRQVG